MSDPTVTELLELEHIAADLRVSNEALGMRLRNGLGATNALSLINSLKDRIDQILASREVTRDYCSQCGGPCLRRPRHGETGA